MRVGLLGGSFNPVHCGHLYLAESALKLLALDQIWWIPAWINPLKQGEPPLAAEERLKMVELAIAPYSDYRLLELECKRGGPSYTVETLRALKGEFPDDEFYLLLGSDTAEELHLWKEINEIFSLTEISIAPRGGPLKAAGLTPAQQERLKGCLLPADEKKISSSELRKRLARGESCEGLIPKEVLDYINQNKLYYSIDLWKRPL